MRARIKQTLGELEASPAQNIIVVGHSHYFRNMFREFLHPDVLSRSPSLEGTLCVSKMPNCGVVGCELDFARGPRVIVDAQCWQPPTIDSNSRATLPVTFAVKLRRRSRKVAPE